MPLQNTWPESQRPKALGSMAMTSPDQATLKDIMVAPVVSVDASTLKEDIAELFAKYHYRMIPIVDAKDHVLGVVHYNDVMKGLVTRPRT